MVLAFADHCGLAPDEVALVGDSLHDLEAARAAGAVAIAVLTGRTGLAARPELEPHADHVIESIADLPDLLDRLAG
jgi:phosphoglycolate phosphatase